MECAGGAAVKGLVRSLSALVMFVLLLSGVAHAGGIRAALDSGVPLRWEQPNLLYYTDAGSLSQYVSHDAADALVASAASVWNVKVASLTLGRGGSLDEDVNGSNVYLGSSGPIWPIDVRSSNASAKPVAVVYDADGSLTDMLRGTGASAPTNCQAAATTDSMDGFSASGMYQHAILVINGRCTGPSAEAQMQLQYQLIRAFGRLLGLGWSQLNDNVFTGVPSPTSTQRSYWPIMHPIDIVCGMYTYQCLPDPFTLRPDDVASLALLYPNGKGSALAAGKTYTLQNAISFDGSVQFPGGAGMAGVNVVVKRGYPAAGLVEDFEIVSGASGYLMRPEYGNPVTGPVAAGVTGSTSADNAGKFSMTAVPVDPKYPWMSWRVGTQAMNPLYVGQYAIMPYRVATVMMSGTSMETTFPVVGPGVPMRLTISMGTQASGCSAGRVGTEAQPADGSASGLVSGQLCGTQRSGWWRLQAIKGHTVTVEATALDEGMSATSGKARLVLGMWHATDAMGLLPTMGAAAAFGGRLNGMSTMTKTFTTSEPVRFAVADARGEARPDFNYVVRVLGVNTVSPERLGVSGGRLVVKGSGFQNGNVVTVGGLLATVQSLTPTEIVVIAPPMDAKRSAPSAADVVVTDLKTGGVARMEGAIQYGGASSDAMEMMSAPTGTVAVGSVAPVMLAVRLVDLNGAAVAGGAVTFSASAAAAKFDCGASPCAVMTDSSGVARTRVTPITQGSIALQATSVGGASVSTAVQAVPMTRTVVAVKAVQYVASGQAVRWSAAAAAFANGVAANGVQVDWTGVAGAAASSTTNADGVATNSFAVTLGAGESAVLSACAWTGVCTKVSAAGVAASEWRLQAVSGTAQSLGVSATLSDVTVRVVNASGEAVAGVPVVVTQRVEGWQPACLAGRCAAAPVYGGTSQTIVSDADGLVTFAASQFASTATLTRVMVSAGQNGYLSFSLEKHP